MDLFAIIAAERRRLADLLGTLTDAQWGAPSLCAGWTVRHVAAHLVTPFAASRAQMVGALIRRRSIAGVMDVMARRLAERPTGELVDLLRRHAASRFTPPGSPPAAPLTDILVHGMDIRWPLGRQDDRPDPAALGPVLDFVAGPNAARGFIPGDRLAGLRLVATDIGWSHGAGAPVEGPALPLAMAVLGRRVAVPELRGDGAATLAARL